MGGLTVKVAGAEAPPPGAGLVTITLRWPDVAMADAGTVTVSEVLVTLLGVKSVPPKLTVAPVTKVPPFTVSVNCPRPAVVAEGLRLEMVGVGLLTVKVNALDAPPPGAALLTVTFREPAVLIADAGTLTVI
jgi:hypothetical protein